MNSKTIPLPLGHNWKLRQLFLSNIIIALLLISFLSPLKSVLWDWLDLKIFKLLNHPLKEHGTLRIFWALVNHHVADWFEDLVILGFYFAGVWKAKASNRRRRSIQFALCIVITALTILCVNRLLCRDLLSLRRESPTRVVESTVYLLEYLSWLPIKVDSSKSFPGDHATIALMFACSYAYLVRGKLGLGALAYGIFLCLPRLVVGAHWPSDIIVGSGSIVLFSLSWIFFTPLFDRCIHKIDKVLLRRNLQ